jgi:hypothetical protein
MYHLSFVIALATMIPLVHFDITMGEIDNGRVEDRIEGGFETGLSIVSNCLHWLE